MVELLCDVGWFVCGGCICWWFGELMFDWVVVVLV